MHMNRLTLVWSVVRLITKVKDSQNDKRQTTEMLELGSVWVEPVWLMKYGNSMTDLL